MRFWSHIGSVIADTLSKLRADNATGYAAEIAYWFIFSLFPFLLFLVSLPAFLPVRNMGELLAKPLRAVVPAEAWRLVEDEATRIATRQNGGLLSLGALTALWSSTGGITAVMEALNKVNGAVETRSFLQVQATALLLVLGLVLSLLAATILLISGERIGSLFKGRGVGSGFEVLWNRLRIPVLLVLACTVISTIYYVAPACCVRWHWITPGSVLAVVAWMAGSVGFSRYVGRFGDYGATYGSIGAVIILLTWLYVGALALLAGAELDAVLAARVKG